MTTNDSNRVLIFDTTLRDGEQSPGAAMNLDEKIRIAEALDDLGVDVIEAGFAVSSRGDFEAVNAIAKRTKHATVCSLSRSARADIDAASEATKPAKRRRIHTFIATSPLHMKVKLRMTPEEVYDAVIDSVSYARRLCDDVEWSCEDGTRTDHDFLCRVVEAAIKSGASTINIPDTVGYTIPSEYFDLISMLRNRVPNIDKARLSTHCHNDLGLAVANSLTAVAAGARQVECTVNGIGERAGNAALEEIVMALRTRHDAIPYKTGVKTENIVKTSRLVAAITGMAVQNNKAIVGANAFAHESGIHQDGVLKNAATYEIMTPESVGLSQSKIVLGKLSGKHAFKKKLEDLGYALGDNALKDSFRRFKDLADKKRDIFDEDLIALVDDGIQSGNERVKFVSLEIVCGSRGPQKADLELDIDGAVKRTQAHGDGPVDAAFKAIKDLFPHTATLKLFQVHAVTEGTDAQAEVTVRLEENGRTVNGQGADTDTLVAATRAYINALNKLLVKREKSAPAALWA
ncbi:MAG: 2-isopropylmalate synthase [Alphaproteobacteria bacterium]|nr:2-isopropylmalate synthase [Alphaproteobacteria bacterium]